MAKERKTVIDKTIDALEQKKHAIRMKAGAECDAIDASIDVLRNQAPRRRTKKVRLAEVQSAVAAVRN